MIGGWDCLSTGYLRYLLNLNRGKDVHVAFCSLGGYVKDGLEMNQLFKDHGKVHAHAFGMNASISTIAMLGCKTIDIVKGSFFLIHNTSMLILKYDQQNKEQLDEYIKTVTKQRNDLNTFDDALAQMYADKSGKTKEECAEQAQKLDEALAETSVGSKEEAGQAGQATQQATGVAKELATVKDELAKALKELDEKDEQIKNLQGSSSPKDGTNGNPADQQPALTARAIADSVKGI